MRVRITILTLVVTLVMFAAAQPGPARAEPSLRDGGGDSLIDERSPDDPEAGPRAPADPQNLPGWAREFVAGSLAKYEAAKVEAAFFRRQGWYPSFFLSDPARDVTVESGSGVGKTVTIHLSYAYRDLEQRVVIAPARRFILPGADRAFLGELLVQLATASPEIALVRARFWFGDLKADGRMAWEHRGGIGLTAQSARSLRAGVRTPETVWPKLDENTLPAELWEE